MPKYVAYWLSPNEKIIPVTGNDNRHIHQIINNPEKFGLTLDYIKKMYKKYKEKLYSEGNARNEIMLQLVKNGWSRIRYVSNQDFFTIQISKLDKSVKETIWDWAVGITRKFDKLSKYVGVKIINLIGDVLYDGNIEDIISYNAFQEECNFKYEDRFCLIEDYYPSFSDTVLHEKIARNSLKDIDLKNFNMSDEE